MRRCSRAVNRDECYCLSALNVITCEALNIAQLSVGPCAVFTSAEEE